MKKTVYFSISKSNRVHFNNEIEIIKNCLLKFDYTLDIFVDKYNFTVQQEKEMMCTAFNEIDNCDIFIAELTKKAIGVGVEAGYAKAKNKSIIYIRKIDSKYSTTVGGLSDYKIAYTGNEHLKNEFAEIIKSL